MAQHTLNSSSLPIILEYAGYLVKEVCRIHASTSLDPLGNAEERHLRTLVLT
jgi:hypothetical protein